VFVFDFGMISSGSDPVERAAAHGGWSTPDGIAELVERDRSAWRC
jgi:hypothetical protein